MSRTFLAMIALTVLNLFGCSQTHSTATTAGPPSEFGIEILAVHLVSEGDLVQLDYRVTDYEKAKSVLHGEVRIAPEDGTGRLEVMSLGRLGPMKQRPARSGSRQFMLFTNTGRVLKKGGRAVVILGSGRIPGVPIT